MRSVVSLGVLLVACASDPATTPDASPSSSDAVVAGDAAPDAPPDAPADAYIPPAIVASAPAVTVVEGSTATVDVHLDRPPSSPVTVTVTTTTGVSAELPALTFDAATYAVPQTVTLTAAQDDDLADGTATITLEAPSLDAVVLGGTITDDDAQAITSSLASITVNDPQGMGLGGTTSSFTVRLAFRPAAPVTIGVALTSPIATLGTTSLTFDPATYDTPQTVSVTAIEDDDTVDAFTQVRLTSTNIPERIVNVIHDDYDLQDVATDAIAFPVELDEGASTTLGVRLVYRPSGGYVVSISGPGAPFSVSPSGPLTFTEANWDIPQTITVTAGFDTDVANNTNVMSFYSPSEGVMAQVAYRQRDRTIVETHGSTANSSTSQFVAANRVLALPTTITNASTLDRLTTTGFPVRVAVYTSTNGAPDALVVGLDTTGNGPRDVSDTALTPGTYWLAIWTTSSMDVNTFATTTTRCERALTGTTWPAAFGPSTCASGPAFSVSATTYRQP